jgi:adenine-specific DNA-methyltransferase
MPLPLPPQSCKVYTARSLALAMVNALGVEVEAEWLEPAVGSGVFVDVLRSCGVRSDKITAIDLDVQPSPFDHCARTLRQTDFLVWARSVQKRFDRIVGNPPYVNLSRLPAALQQSALNVTNPAGNQLRLNGNSWYAFLCASLNLLKPGGNLAFVLPASLEYADYAAELRASLTSMFKRVEIHRSKKPMFPDVQEGSVVMLAFGYGISGLTVIRREHTDLVDLVTSLKTKSSATNLRGRSEDAPKLRSGECRLGEIVAITLGGVTGDAKYFLMSDPERCELELPVTALRPVLSKAKHLTSWKMDFEDWRKLKENGERIWLFDPPPGQLKHPGVKRYINLKVSDGGCHRDRYKVGLRDPWFRTPLPHIVDGFISGMSKSGPWISLKAMSGLTATNTLYVVRFRKRLSREEKCAWCLSMMSSRTRAAATMARRVYADGLHKHEPGDLLKLPVIRPVKSRGAIRHYRLAIEALQDGDSAHCSRLADEWLLQGDNSVS